jgi:hypothetical protein
MNVSDRISVDRVFEFPLTERELRGTFKVSLGIRVKRGDKTSSEALCYASNEATDKDQTWGRVLIPSVGWPRMQRKLTRLEIQSAVEAGALQSRLVARCVLIPWITLSPLRVHSCHDASQAAWDGATFRARSIA